MSNDKQEEDYISKSGRTIIFYEEIDDFSALQVNKLLLALDGKLHKKYKKQLRKAADPRCVKKPIICLRIQSPGGDVFASLSIIDVINQLFCDVHTYIDGCAASGAAMIALHGNVRHIGKNGFMLLHQLSGQHSGKYADMQDEIKNSEKLMGVIRNMVKGCSKITSIDEVNELLKHEWWLTAEECLEKGFVDKIVG